MNHKVLEVKITKDNFEIQNCIDFFKQRFFKPIKKFESCQDDGQNGVFVFDIKIHTIYTKYTSIHFDFHYINLDYFVK